MPLAAAPKAGPREVSFAIDKDGLKWTGPCRAVFFYAGEPDEELAVVLSHPDTSAPARVAPGKYELLVACPSTEGEIALTQPIVVGAADLVAKVRLRPAFAVVRVIRDGKEVPASLSITDRFGREVQKGRDRVALPVPAGALRISAVVDKQAVDTTRVLRGAVDVVTREGQKVTPTIDTSDGTLHFLVTNNGRPSEGVGALRAPQSRARLVEVTSGVDTPVPPGVYDLVTQLSESHDFSEVVKRGVRIEPRKRIALTVAHDTGRLEPQLVFDGKPHERPADVDIQLFQGALPQPFNTLDEGEAAVLAPAAIGCARARRERSSPTEAPSRSRRARASRRGRRSACASTSPPRGSRWRPRSGEGPRRSPSRSTRRAGASPSSSTRRSTRCRSRPGLTASSRRSARPRGSSSWRRTRSSARASR